MDNIATYAYPGLSQHARLITLDCPAAPLDTLVAEQFTGREGIDALFHFELDALATDADFDIDALAGSTCTIGLLQPDGSRRHWHGLCTRAGTLGADGGVARYRLCLEPALAQLQHRRDSHLFQDMDVRAIVADLLADYPGVPYRFDVTRTLAPHAICTQYRETDFAFLCRVLALDGLCWRFEHAAGSHQLVIFDAGAAVPATPGGATLRFHGVRATDVDDAIDGWHAERVACANGVALSRWDPAQLVAPSAGYMTQLDAGTLPSMQVYDGSGERIAGADAASHALVMLQALERRNKTFQGAGAVRRMAAGHGFVLTQHAHYPPGENGFTVLWVEHTARNNLRTGIRDAATGAVADGTYRNTFACVRDTVALVPAAAAAITPRRARGTQVALVVGLPGAVATTNRDHQIRIQFPWQRGARPNPGGLDHPGKSGGNAPGDASCGAWVRVAEGLAGPNWGSQFTPRIGTEVLVAFIEGDIDRPVIVGQLHNGVAPPPFPACAGAAANHPHALSGVHSANVDGSGYNQWQLDDTHGEARMRLASASAASELHLGHLVEQPFGTALRGAARGSGVDLRTTSMAVLRGAAGVLLSSNARSATATSVTSTQMDAREAVALLRGAHRLDAALTQVAREHHALASDDASHAQAKLADLFDPRADGRYDGPVGGQEALQPVPGARDLDPAHAVERFGAPAVMLDCAATLNWATAASTVISAGRQLHWTTQSDMHASAGKTWSLAAGHGATLFSHGGGVRATAANGPVSMQAHTDRLEIIADKEVVAVSVSDVITIAAREKIVLQAGQSSITLEGGNITFACPGKFLAKGGMHILDGGASNAAALTKLPSGLTSLLSVTGGAPTPVVQYDEQIIYQDRHDAPLARMPFKIAQPSDVERRLVDVSPSNGTLSRVLTPAAEPLNYGLRYVNFKFD